MGELPKILNRAGAALTINRRNFLFAASAAGGAVAFGLRPAPVQAATNDGAAWMQSEGEDFTAFITITPDNMTVVRTTTPDMGNGTFIGNQMMVCEELHCDWEMVKGEYLPANRDLREGGEYSKTGPLAYFAGRTTGSAVMQQVMQVAASTRMRLIQAAADKWGVEADQVSAENSMLKNAATGEEIPFADVAADAAAIMLDTEPATTPRDQWTFLGKGEGPQRTNLANIIDGTQKFGIDTVVDGMVYAALRQSPVQGGKLVSVDKEAVMGMPGVLDVVVIDPEEQRPGLPEGMNAPFGISILNAPVSAVAVIAEHYWQAQTALDVLPVEWDGSAGAHFTDTKVMYDEVTAAARDGMDANIMRQTGDATEAMNAPDHVSEYLTAYMDHVNMEPLNGTALVTDDRVEAWLPSQHPQQALYIFADETGIAPENVYVNQMWLGTGLGRRVFGDDARMVAAVANKYRGTPVQVIWSREESMRQGRYRNMVAGTFRAKLKEDGMPSQVMISTAGGGGIGLEGAMLANSPYELGVDAWHMQSVNYYTNLKIGPWRGPVFNSNTFMVETFINELAEKAGMDAIEYRQKLLANYEDKSWSRLLDVVADKSGWGGEMERGLAQGVAIGNWGMAGNPDGGPQPFSGSTVACVVTAEVTRRGEIYIPRVDVAVDTGSYINERMIKAGCESGVVLSLGAAMFEELNVQDGRVVEGNLDTYRVIRQNDTVLPMEIHVHMDGMSGHERFGEIGEPPVGAPPPALAHAIYKLTGTWIRQKPFSKTQI